MKNTAKSACSTCFIHSTFVFANRRTDVYHLNENVVHTVVYKCLSKPHSKITCFAGPQSESKLTHPLQ